MVGSPLIKADGGPVLGGAFAFEFGILGVEGRLDATEVGLEFTGARYDLRGTQSPLDGLTASVTVFEGRFETDRIGLLSINARIRTPGPVAIVVSGGLSYLSPGVQRGWIHSAAPRGTGHSVASRHRPKAEARLTGRHASEHRWGVNGGAGLRIGGRVALTGEVRVFYFRDYELRFEADNGQILDELLSRLALVRFDRVFVNAQAGVTFRF